MDPQNLRCVVITGASSGIGAETALALARRKIPVAISARRKDRLAEIRRPTLLLSGRYDEATPALQQTLLAGLPDAEWVVFDASAHVPHVEEPERYRSVLSAWLARHD